MIYMGKWNYHECLGPQSKKALLSAEKTCYREVMHEDSGFGSRDMPTERSMKEAWQ